MYARLKLLRESLGLTQEEFGKSVGIAKTTYNNYETGIRDPKSDFWISVAKKYNVTIDYLMGFSDNPSRSPSSSSEDLQKSGIVSMPFSCADDGELKLVGMYRDMNEEGKHKLLDCADDMVQSGKYKKVCSFYMGSKDA